MPTASKTEAFDLFEAYRREWLASARAFARQLGRSGAPVTINEVRKFGPAIPDGVDPRVAGAVFMGDEWECQGYVKSSRRLSHGRPVAQFILRG